MNGKQILLGLVLADFVGFTLYAIYVHGLVGLFEAVLSTTAGQLAMVDLTIALSLILIWLWQDAGRRGISPIPYVLLTLGLGSVGPLLYLIRVSGNEARSAVPSTARGLA
ncbi:MAG: DUF2834 domain-containing protein [Candidatus Binatia bacterium]